MSAELTIRHERPDSDIAKALFSEYLELVFERLGSDFKPVEEIFATEEDFALDDSAWIVLYRNGEPIGCGGLRVLEPGVGELKRMFVTAAERGKGFGRHLLLELETIARERKLQRLRLLTTDVLFEARALYESSGYAVSDVVVVDGRTDYWLEKQL